MPLPLTLQSTLVAIVTMAAALAGAPVQAVGFGAATTSPVLGHPLDLAVPLRIDPGESVSPDCISAEVWLGERRLPDSLVQAVVERRSTDAARVRVATSPPVDEPVVIVTITAGCSSSVARRYVLFADPPGIAPAAMAPSFAARPELVPPAVTDPPPAGAPVPAVMPQTATEVAPAPPTDEPAPSRSASETAPRRAAPAAAPRAEPARRPRSPVRTAAAPRAAANPPANVAAPRLRLEVAAPLPDPGRAAQARAVDKAVEEALAAVAQAASSVRAAASAASAAEQRIATLERTVEQLRTEARNERELALQLRERLSGGDAATRWVTPLLALVLVLAAVALWLAWRVMSIQRQREAEWRLAVAPPAPAVDPSVSRQPTSPIPFVVSEISSAPGQPTRARSAPAWPPPAPADEADDRGSVAPPRPAVADDVDMQRTMPLPGPGRGGAEGGRDVTIEELIDLEQQAEFFVVLGQDDAAIDLLVEHLRHTGGSSPLPYLKLLEIYGRRADREAYERMRARFNRRFNAYAPEWGADLSHGRTLEDYPGVIPRLQRLWGQPADAMAELESLLFSRDRGELFDLPAYREVLFLYSLARDLLDREAVASGSVDLLLPIADGAEFGPTTPRPFLGLESDAMPLGAEERSVTAPVDLDLTRPEGPGSIFDLPEDPATRATRPG